MNTGAFVTRATIWAALLCYGAVTVLAARRNSSAANASRIIWTAGCVLLLAHLAAAFHFYHHWSHSAAAEDTRRQTLERLGFDFSSGIYFNYAFTLVWLADCVRWWTRKPITEAPRGVWRFAVHLFFLFMIFNSTVVFGHGVARFAGAVICLLGICALLVVRRRRSTEEGYIFFG
jgi:hypothetical protein